MSRHVKTVKTGPLVIKSSNRRSRALSFAFCVDALNCVDSLHCAFATMADWDDDVEIISSASSAAAAASAPPRMPSGVWDQQVVVNKQTTITMVTFPLYDPKAPLSGTKPARVRVRLSRICFFFVLACRVPHSFRVVCVQQAFLQALKDENGGKNPLHLRKELEEDGVTSDPYYKFAPGQTTLGWSKTSAGVKPEVVMPPAEIAQKVQRAAAKVPFIRSVQFFLSDKNGKTRTTLEHIIDLNLPAATVPNLYQNTVPPVVRIQALEQQMNKAETEIKALRGLIATLEAKVNGFSSSFVASAPSTPSTVGEKRQRTE